MGYKATKTELKNTGIPEVKGILRPFSLTSSFIEGTTTKGQEGE